MRRHAGNRRSDALSKHRGYPRVRNTRNRNAINQGVQKSAKPDVLPVSRPAKFTFEQLFPFPPLNNQKWEETCKRSKRKTENKRKGREQRKERWGILEKEPKAQEVGLPIRTEARSQANLQ